MSSNRPLSPVQIIPLLPDKRLIANNRCRTCLTTNVILYPIFAPGLEEFQSKELNVITGDTIKLNDGLPQHMCKECKLSFTIALQFRKTCNRAQETLLKSYKIKTEMPDPEIDGKNILNIPVISPRNSGLTVLGGNFNSHSTLSQMYQQNNIETVNNLSNLYKAANQTTISKPSCHPASSFSISQSKPTQASESTIKQILEAPLRTTNIDKLKADLSILDRLGTAVTVCTAPSNNKPENVTVNQRGKSNEPEPTKNTDRLGAAVTVCKAPSNIKPDNLTLNQPGKSNEPQIVTKTIDEKSFDMVKVKQEIGMEIELDPTDYLYENDDSVAENFNVNIKVELEKLDDDDAIINAEKEFLDKSMPHPNEPTNFEPESNKPVKKAVKKYRPRKKEILDPNNLRCEECNRDFSRISSYRDHMRFHEVYVECEICGKRHRNIHALGIHKRTQHNFEWIHKCSYCDYRSSTKEGLTVHERTHTGEKPYICDHCGASFHRRALIVQHVDLHAEKNSQCPLCEKLFPSQRLVRMHIAKTHNANRYSYQCTVCGITLNYSQSVKKHLMKQHDLPRHLKGLVLRVPRKVQTQNSGNV